MPKAIVSASVDLEVANWIVAEAAKTGKSLSKFLGEALKEYFKLKTQQQVSGRKPTIIDHDFAKPNRG